MKTEEGSKSRKKEVGERESRPEDRPSHELGQLVPSLRTDTSGEGLTGAVTPVRVKWATVGIQDIFWNRIFSNYIILFVLNYPSPAPPTLQIHLQLSP